MRKSLFLLSSAALIGFSALSFPAVARDRSERTEMTANQLVDQFDARTARLKVELRLTPDQEKNWAGFEGAMQGLGKTRADRIVAIRDERAKDKGAVDVLDQINRRADSQIALSNDWKKLADAAKPLYASLDEQQKQRFAEQLLGGERDAEHDSTTGSN